MGHNLTIVVILAVGFAVASLFGYIAQRLKLPSMLGYLLAGYLIGPYSPGYVANLEIAEELASIGIILMLFGVGLHFKVSELIRVKNVAVPGAIGQTLVAALAGATVVTQLGYSLENGVILGLAIAVASTVVLLRILSDEQLLDTPQGHISVGWLIVEDIITVIVLLLLPSIPHILTAQQVDLLQLSQDLGFVLGKFALLCLLMFTIVEKLATYILAAISRLRSHELFTISVLALVFVIATLSSVVFGISIALGAFLAGIVVGQTEVRHQAAANALPVKDLFVVVFFLSVGMLFNPLAIASNWLLFFALLAVILLVKPLVAILLVSCMKYPLSIALTVAFALAQIGEFSFILAEEAMRLNLLTDTGFDLLVACAIVSISINPFLFRLLRGSKSSQATLLDTLRRKVTKHAPNAFLQLFHLQKNVAPKVIVVGFGPVGEAITKSLKHLELPICVVEQNIDTVSSHQDESFQVVYGDAAQPNILESTHIGQAKLLVITVPDVDTAVEIVHAARERNHQIKIMARVKYITDMARLEALNVRVVCAEKEVAKTLSEWVNHFIRHT